MLRSISGFVLGWLVMGLLVMASFVVGPLVLGVERVLEPGTYEATTLWVVLAMGIGLVAGAAGGWVAARVGRGTGPVAALALLMVLSTACTELNRSPAPEPAAPVERPAEQDVMELLAGMQEHGREPLVTRIGNPLVGLLGLALGAGLALRGARRREA